VLSEDSPDVLTKLPSSFCFKLAFGPSCQSIPQLWPQHKEEFRDDMEDTLQCWQCKQCTGQVANPKKTAKLPYCWPAAMPWVKKIVRLSQLSLPALLWQGPWELVCVLRGPAAQWGNMPLQSHIATNSPSML